MPARRLAPGAAIACTLFLFLGFAGCGGGSTGGSGGGPAPSAISLTTSSVKVPWNAISGGSVNLTANVTSSKTPGGTVTFSIDGSSGFSSNSLVARRSCTISTQQSLGWYPLHHGSVLWRRQYIELPNQRKPQHSCNWLNRSWRTGPHGEPLPFHRHQLQPSVAHFLVANSLVR